MQRAPNFFGLDEEETSAQSEHEKQRSERDKKSGGDTSPAFVFGKFPSFSPTMRFRKSFSSTPSSSSVVNERTGTRNGNIMKCTDADMLSLSSPTSSHDSSNDDCGSNADCSTFQSINLEQDHADVPILHQRLREARSIEDLQDAASIVTVAAACYADAQGRTAMHILSENKFLAETIVPSYQQNLLPSPTLSHSISNSARSPSGMMLSHAASSRTTSTGSTSSAVSQNGEHDALMHFLVQVLWPAYHAALMTTDKNGYIPFEAAIHVWVQSVYDRHSHHRMVSGITSHGSSTSNKIALPSILDLNVTARWKNNSTTGSVQSINSKINLTSQDGNNVEAVAANNHPDLEIGRTKQHKSTDISRVKVFPKRVRISPQALYSIMMLSALLDELIDTMDAAQMLSSRSNRSGRRARGRSTRDNFRTAAFKDMSAAIVQTVASIPDFVKIILFLDDEDQRDELLNTTLMKHVLLSGYSVGPWLTGMLQSHDKRASALALEYLRIVSSMSLNDDDSEQDHIMRRQKNDQEIKLRNEFYLQASRIDDFVPSLLSLGEEKIEEAATTEVVQQVLDRMISRPFAVTVVFCDAIFLALLIFGYRGAANGLVLGASSATILAYIHVSNTGIFYFVVRELGKIISLCMVTRKARTYFVSFWNLVDLSTVALALASTLAIRSQMTGLRGLCAITTGFMWLRVLSYLKGINMQLATFVLAILQITRDILWFCVILFIVIVLFSQMFFTLLAPDSCAVKETRESFECSQNEYYLKVYAILLGDFGLFQRDSFTSAFSIILAVLYTFMVVLVLLNVLIAVASDSYEKCMLRSHNLFGRARVMMVAELVSFQNLLRRSIPHGGPTSSSSAHGGGPLDATWWSSESWIRGWSRGSVVFFSLASLVALAWTIGELVGYLTGALKGNVWLSFGSICVNVTLFVGIMMFLASGANEGAKDDDTQNPIFFFRWYGQYFQQTMVRFLGSSNGKYGASSDSLVWNGRLLYLSREMTRLSEETKRDCTQMLKAVETTIHHGEHTTRTELCGLEKLVSELLSEQKEMKEQFTTLLEKRHLV